MNGLNAEQAAAVEQPHTTPVAVIAGAGTGKTHLLTARFVRLVQHVGLAPDRILCLTFTRKAAQEMRTRILLTLREAGHPVPHPSALWVMTFDAAAWRVLRDNPLDAGLSPDARLLNEGEAALLEERVWAAACADDADPFGPVLGALWERTVDIRTAAFSTLASLAKVGVTLAEIPEHLSGSRHPAYVWLREHFEARLADSARFKGRAAMERAVPLLEAQEHAEAATAGFLRTLGEQFAAARDAAHVLTFADVLQRATDVCARDEGWRGRFDAVLVDECQDTNGAQFRFIRALAHPDYANVTIVGDRKQSIYSFQGARPENTLELDVPPVSLVRNYRSVGEILRAAHQLIHPLMPDDPALEPTERGWAEAPRVWFTRLTDEPTEAQWIAAEVVTLRDAGVPLEDIMILARTRGRFPALRTALQEAGVPYVVVDKAAARDQPILKTALALLRLALNPLDDLAAVRLLQEPPIALSDADLFPLLRDREDRSVVEHLHACEDPELRARAVMLDELVAAAGTLPGAEFVSHAIRRWGLLQDALQRDGADRANFRALAQLYAAAARAFAAAPAPSLGEFVDAVREGRVAIQTDQAGETAPPRAAVRVSNVHQVKGLEFPVVFIAGLGVRRFPDTQTVATHFCYDEHLGFAQLRSWEGDGMVRWRLDGGGAYETDLREQWRARKIAEEHRLLYVAMTRAQERLYLTTSTPPVASEKLDEPEYFVERLEEWIATGAEGTQYVSPQAHAPAPLPREVEAICDGKTREAPTPAAVDLPTLVAEAEAARERIGWRPPPAPAASLLTLSFTQVTTYRQCPRLYEFRYVQRLPAFDGRVVNADETPGRGDARGSAAARGRLVHRALELFHTPTARQTGDMHAALDVAYAEETHATGLDRADAEALLNRYTQWDIARADVAGCEVDFVVLIPGAGAEPAVRVRGTIDRIDRVPAGIAIWDYKTGDANPASLRAKYALQVQLYANAAERALDWGPVQRAGLIALKAESESAAVVDSGIDVSEAGIAAALDEVRDTARGIRAGAFTVQDTHAARPCQWCEHRAWCPDRRESVL